jgi:diguanylate cyclase (GGDEF)-like protein/PAS domain S-box-containing protein
VPPDDDGPPADRPHPLASLPDAVYHLDHDWRFTYANRAFEDMVGRSSADLLGRRLWDCFPRLTGTPVEAHYRAVLADGRPRHFEYLHEHWDRWFELRAYPDSAGLTVFIRDIDELRRAGARAQAELDQLTAVLETLPAATVLLDDDFRILTANCAWTSNGEALRAAGVEPAGVGDDYLASMARGIPAVDHAVLAAGLQELIEAPAEAGSPLFEHLYAAPLGERTAWFRVQATRVRTARRIVVSHLEETQRVLSQRELERQARHDDLTGLPNRTAMLELVEAAMAEDGNGPALLVLDLDAFKTINDSLGHQLGDALLGQVADRLVEQIRPGDAVGRLGGDQFLVLAADCDDAEATSLAFRLQKSFDQPFTAAGITVPLSACIGVAVAGPARTPHDLLSDADAAMYAAKATGPDRLHLFSPALREAARWRLEVATRLRDDATDQLVVHYQPVVHLGSGAVEGVEALVRWQHPERGMLMPDAFLSVAEETGQVIPITRWLLRETTTRAAAWAADGFPLRMSVNISARHFSAETLVRDVRAALRDSGLPPDQLVLELTETSIAEDPTRAEDQLAVLRSNGVRIAIDDFGTGWSSLARLFTLPIGTLKIDRSLLTAAEQVAGGETGAVLAAIVGLTRTLGIRAVAEGVETADHLRMVRAAGCDLAQGWLLGQPMPAEEIPGFVRRVRAAGGDLCALVEQECTAG